MVIRAWKMMFLNLFTTHAIFVGLFFSYLMPLRGCNMNAALPPITIMIRDLIISAISVEILFYYIHAFLHTKFLYRYVHYVHHEFKVTSAVSFIHAHPVESVLNDIAVFSGPLLCGAHASTLSIWVILSISSSMTVHSGWKIPGMQSPLVHDWHHLFPCENLGIGPSGFLDEFYGTNKQWKKISKTKR